METGRHFRGTGMAPGIALGLVVALATALVAPMAAFAAAPTNDERGDATLIEGVTVPGFSTSIPVDMTGATYPDATGDTACGPTPTRTVWYRFTATMSGRVTVTAAESAASDPSITGYLRLSSTGAMTRYPCAAGTTSFAASTGGTYYIQAGDTGAGGTTLRLNITFSSAVSYDRFALARGMSAVWHTDVVDLSVATSELGEPQLCGASTRTVWYRYLAGTAGRLTFDPSASTTDGTVLNAYRDTGAGMSGLVALGCSNGPLTFDVAAGTTYYVQAADAAPSAGFLSVTWSFALAADRNPPVFQSTPSDIGRLTDSPDGLAVAYPVPEAIDDVDGKVDVTCNPPSGSLFSVGSTLVTCTARDAAGNSGSVRFMVRVDRPTSVTQDLPILSYDVRLTPQSGWWGYGHTYDGTVAATGRMVQGGTYARPVLNYSAGNGTLDDGLATVTVDNQLFSLQLDTTGQRISPVIVLHLDGLYDISAISLFGGDGSTWAEAGAVAAVTVTISDRSARVVTRPFGARTQFQAGNNDFVDLAATPLAGVATDTIVLSGFEAELGLWIEPYQMFSLAEITVAGSPADVTPPVLTLPADLIVEAQGPSGSAVEYVPSAVDAVDGEVASACTWPSGSTFPIGQTSVSCSATDSSGNMASGSFTVTVLDRTAPTVAYEPHAAIFTVADSVRIGCTATDAVGLGPTTCTPIAAFGWDLGIGVHTYSTTVTDAAGNVGRATTAFTVIATYGSMADLTKQWVSKAGVAKDLVAILDSAAAARQRGQLQAEADKLAEFRAMVNAQAGKSITTARAALLVTFSTNL